MSLFTLSIVLLLIFADATYSKMNTEVTLPHFGRLFFKTVILCNRKENFTFTDCVKESTLLSLDALTRSENTVELMSNSVSLVKTKESPPPAEHRSAKYLLSIIDQVHSSNRSQVIDDLLRQVFVKFVDTRSVNIRFPISALKLYSGYSSDENNNARGKKDKGSGMLMMGAMMAGTAMAMKIAVLAAMSGKALMTSLMAFVLAALAALKKHSGNEHHTGTTYEVINVPTGGHGHHHARSDTTQNYHSSGDNYYPLPDYELYAKQRQ